MDENTIIQDIMDGLITIIEDEVYLFSDNYNVDQLPTTKNPYRPHTKKSVAFHHHVSVYCISNNECLNVEEKRLLWWTCQDMYESRKTYTRAFHIYRGIFPFMSNEQIDKLVLNSESI